MHRWLYLVIALIAVGAPQRSTAQAIQFVGEEQPLEEALLALHRQAGVDVVFAQRLVVGRTVACEYKGDNPEAALECLLQDTELRAEHVRANQYVLVGRDDLVSPPGRTPEPSRRSTLAGVVTDAETGAVLPSAHVYLPGLETGTVTDRSGHFSLATLPSGAYRVKVSYLGYQTQDTVLAAGTEPARIRLQPATLEAPTVVVEGRRQDPEGYTAAPGLINMPVKELEELPSFIGGKDLFQAFQWLPGVRHTGEVNGGLVVQGGTPDQNLYLLDGAPIYHPWHAFSLISTFQTGTFKNVKLYRGSFPAEHGGRLSSVLNAEMKDGSSRSRPHATAAVGVLSGRFRFESPITRNSSFMVAGRRSYLDKIVGREHAVENENGLRDTLRTGYYFYDLSAKVTHQPSPRHRLSLSYYHGRDNLDLRLPFDVSLDFSSWLRPAPLFFEIGHNWENQLYSLRSQYLYSPRIFVTTTAYYSGYHAEEQTLIQPTASARIASDYGVRIDDIGVQVDLDYSFAPAHRVRAGVQAVRHRFRSSLNANLQRSSTAADSLGQRSYLRDLELVGYVQDTWEPARRWRIQPGLRASLFTGGRYTHLRPRLNVQYALLPGRLSVRGAAGTKVQYMHRLRDRYSFLYDLVSSRWIPTSETVRPATSLQLALGVEGTPWEGVKLSADGYWKRTRNTLLPRDFFRAKDDLEGPGIEVGTLLGQYTPARGRAYGIELAARWERGPWRAWVSYAGGRSLSRAPALGEERYHPDRFDVPRSLRSVVHRSGSKWSVTVSTELRSGFPHTVPVSRYALGDPLEEDPVRYLSRPHPNNGRLPPYLRFDLALGYQFELVGGEWRATLQLYNVTNRRNVVRREYDPRPTQVETEDHYGFPILPLMELEMQL